MSQSDRTKAERSLDRWNESIRKLRAIPDPTAKDRIHLREYERRAASARRTLHQMRDGDR